MPTFMSLQCFSDNNGTSANTTRIVNSGVQSGGSTLPSTFGKGDADPRLSGGVGSAERKKLRKVMEQMEKDGFRQGMIGLKKGHYY